MGRAGIIVTGLVAIALVIGSVVVLRNDKAEAPTNQNQPATSQTSNGTANSTDSSNTTTQQREAKATIVYDGTLFSPSQVTIKKGDSVEIKNNSQKTIEVYSTPHPVHTDNPELNVGQIKAGETKVVTLSKIGSWGYHNHLDTSQAGTIVVR